MEVGAVKQAFNNEVIQLKRNLNQAKIHTIHKLTRKAKTFTEKKGPEKLKEKLKRKAELAVNEVLILKKVKPKDIAKFAVTHKGNLQDFLNKPKVDHDKVCARLLLHKSLQAKYNYIRNTFSNIPINDLLMSRIERRKMKKEVQKIQKMKKDKKQKVVNAEGDWKVEKLKSSKSNDAEPSEKKISGDDEDKESNREDNSEEEIAHIAQSDDRESNGEETLDSDIEEQNEEESDVELEDKVASDQEMGNDDLPDEESNNDSNMGKFVRPSPIKIDVKPKTNHKFKNEEKLTKPTSKPQFLKPPKPKDVNKNKNLNEKLITRKFKKDNSELEVQETKVVDPFFITSTGENYMSVAEPRQPDEVKEIHKQGNRKLRRAAMFGHVPKIKPRSDNSYNYNRQNDSQGGFKNKTMANDGNYKNNFNRNDSQFKGRNDSQFKGRNESKFKGRNDLKNNDKSNATTEPKAEKLHPSWEAKKKKSGILPFQGKKIVFDES